jgi:hypothetical protein
LKAQNKSTKPFSKPQNTYNKQCFETAYLVENAMNLLQQKVAHTVDISSDNFIFSKHHNEPPKVAQFAKIAQSGHPVVRRTNFPLLCLHLLILVK